MQSMIIFTLIVFLSFSQTAAQSNQKPLTISNDAGDAVIEGVLQKFEKNYIFPEVAAETVKAVRTKLKRGDYRQPMNGEELAARLTADLRQICRDKHVQVSFSKDVLPNDDAENLARSPQMYAEMRKMMSKSNFGIEKIEFLPGNVGYLKINVFAPLEIAGENYAAMMNIVADTDALIIDLRDNGGSLSPETIPFLAGYFFAAPVHLTDIYWGNEKATRQYWSANQVAGRKYLDKPVYILIGSRTFSGAEEFAYDFKSLKRAVIIGEASGGGANPGGFLRVNNHFSVFVPFGRVTNPLTQSNWEGTGVVPDVAAASAQSLDTAHRLALEQIEARTIDHPEWRQYIHDLRSQFKSIPPTNNFKK